MLKKYIGSTAFYETALCVAMPILPLYAITQGIEIIKSILGGYMLKRGS